MKCPVCNKRNKSGVGICIHCGAKLPLENLEGEASRNVVDSYKLSISRGLLLGIVISAVILLSILIYFLVKPSNKHKGKIMVNQNSQHKESNSRNAKEEIIIKQSTTNAEKNADKVESKPGKVVIGIVKDYRLRVRHRPSLRSNIVAHLPKGAEVIITKKTKSMKIRVGSRYLSGKWYKIKWEKQTGEGVFKQINGWVWGKYLEIKK